MNVMASAIIVGDILGLRNDAPFWKFAVLAILLNSIVFFLVGSLIGLFICFLSRRMSKSR